MTTYFLNCAQNLVNQSQDELDRGQFLKSWALTVPARAAFVCNAVINAVELPFAMLGVVFRSIQLVFTWGRSSIALQASLANLDLTINQSLDSLVGALISTQLGSSMHSQNFKPFEGLLGLTALFTTLYAVIKIAPHVMPNLLFVSSQGDWTFGWTWWR